MQTEPRFQSRETYYGTQADAAAVAYFRDPVISPSGTRADTASGKHGRWGRYNNPDTLVWGTNIYGVTHALTPNQAGVYGQVQRLACTGIRVTMRALAAELGVAASTVYRALVRLEALGFIAYQSNRGRLGGVVFLLREANDGLDWRKDEAKATLRRWYKASEERISRLRRNVASMFPGRERELYQYRYPSTDTGRNIYPEWTPDDFREAGLM